MFKIKYVIIVFTIFVFTPKVSATKCFKESSFEGIKKNFTYVVKGKIVSRNKFKGLDDRYTLKIKVLSSVKGDFFVSQNIEADEWHSGNKMLGIQKYEIGKEYYFPIEKGKFGKRKYKVYLPADGCPSLPTP
jgi:hypothetical protein